MSLRSHDECTLFRNGNLSLRIPKDQITEFNKDRVLYLSDLLSWMDCEFIGETFNLSNWVTGHLIYNSYMDCCYIFAWDELDRLACGLTVKLYARPVSEEERKLIENE